MKTNTHHQTNHIKAQQLRAIKIGLVSSMLMIFNSLIIGLMVNSITLLLDSSVSMVVAIATGLMYVTVKKVHLPPDDLYNFGYGKFEPFTVMIHGGLVIASCIISVKYAIMNILHVEDISEYALPTIGSFAAIIFAAIIMLYLRRVAKRTGSAMLKSISVQWTNDTISYAGIFTGFFVGWILIRKGYSNITPFIDPGMTIILAVALVRVPIKVVMENILELLDAVPGAPTRSRIKEVIEQYYPFGLEIHRVRSRKAGQKIFVEICFYAPEHLSIIEIEDLSNHIENMLKKSFTHCDVVVSFKAKKKHSVHKPGAGS